MRPASTSAPFSVLVAQLGGWLLVGFLVWLLMLSHEGMAAPAADFRSAAAVELAPATPELPFFGGDSRPGGARTQAAARHRSQRHAAFWQAREEAREGRPAQPTLLGLLLPLRRHHRTDAERAALRTPLRVHYQRTHSRRGLLKLGGALGAIFQRNMGR